jgi:hypothetical protein
MEKDKDIVKDQSNATDKERQEMLNKIKVRKVIALAVFSHFEVNLLASFVGRT